jgi:hypothetical protein
MRKLSQYFAELLNEPQQEIKEPRLLEAEITIRQGKNNKAQYEDNTTAELIKCEGKELAELLKDLRVNIWEKEQMPEDFSAAVICPIWKTSNKMDCS